LKKVRSRLPNSPTIRGTAPVEFKRRGVASPPPAVRAEIAAQLDRLMDEAAAKAKDVADADLEAAVDEAMAQLRRREP
jgi:hypothetical protein